MREKDAIPGPLKAAEPVDNMGKKGAAGKGRSAGARRKAGRETGSDIHNYTHRIKVAKERASGPDCLDGKTILGFLNTMALVGLSPGRQCFYITRIWPILEQLKRQGITRIADITKAQCEAVLSEFISRDYAGETKVAYALCIKKLVNYAKTGRLGSKNDGYVPEISWIVSSQYREKSSGVQRQDLISPDEFAAMVSAAKSTRDRAMLWVMYEGAFRPGELLNMRVGGVEFADRYVMASTTGKTGQKNIALVYSLHPLVEWMSVHPRRTDPDAPLWYSLHSGSADHSLGYKSLDKIIRRAAVDAGIQKPVWPYLLRHTRMTRLAKKLPDQLLCVYGNWKPGSKMTARYTHLSGQDANEAILAMHGIKDAGQDEEDEMRCCPRCAQYNEPGAKLCHGCGFLLDEEARAALNVSDMLRSRLRDKVLRAKALETDIDRMFDDMFGSS